MHEQNLYRFGDLCAEIIVLFFVFFYYWRAGGRGWQWGGCSDNVEFGEKISKQYVDTQETGQDSRAAVNLHNNAAGRLASPVHISSCYREGSQSESQPAAATNRPQCFSDNRL